MSEQETQTLDPVRTKLRMTLATLEREVERLPKGDTVDLTACVADLVKQLALGPEPATRACPRCKRLGMSAATRCGNCWIALTPQ